MRGKVLRGRGFEGDGFEREGFERVSSFSKEHEEWKMDRYFRLGF